jgi:predicted ester cyclase
VTKELVAQVLERNITAVNARDVTAYTANQQPDVEFVLPGGVVLRGRDQVGAYAQMMWSAFPDGTLAFTSQVISEDSAAVEITFTGTHTGPLVSPDGTVPPTGKQVSLQSASILQIRDGLIASEHVYLDQMQLLAQLGVTGQAGATQNP